MTRTTHRLAGGDLEDLNGEADGALDAKVLGASAFNQLAAHLLEGLDIARGQGNADAVDFLR